VAVSFIRFIGLWGLGLASFKSIWQAGILIKAAVALVFKFA
jgi:hypothetical protein